MLLDPREFEDRLDFREGVAEPFRDFPYAQNGLDIRIFRVDKLQGPFRCVFDGKGCEKVRRGSVTLLRDTPFMLRPLEFYEFESHVFFKKRLPRGVAAYIIGRSSFGRNGVLIRSSLYDSGYKGVIGASIYAKRQTEIAMYFRVAQLIFINAETISMYNHNKEIIDE